MLNLDTNLVVHAVTGQLTREERRLLATNQWTISAIVLWEIAKLSQLGRVEFDLDDPEVSRALMPVHVWPITARIAMLSTQLDFRSDPADELIAATSVAHRVPLLTRDRRLRRSKLVPLAIR